MSEITFDTLNTTDINYETKRNSVISFKLTSFCFFKSSRVERIARKIRSYIVA